MIHEKTKIVILIGLISIILFLLVPTSKIFFVTLIGLLFVIPIVALSSIVVIGAYNISKMLKKQSKPEKEESVISA